MSLSPPPQGFSGPQNLEQHPSQGDTTGVSPLAAPGQLKKRVPLGFSAGGGLLVGVIAGLVLIGGGNSSKAEAAGDPDVVVVKAPTTFGDLADEGETVTAVKTPAGEVGTKPDPAELAAAAAKPIPTATVGDPAPSTAPTMAIAPAAKPEPKPIVPEPTPTNVELRFTVSGLEGGVAATITLDNTVVRGMAAPFTIAAGKSKQKAKLVVRAKGYRPFRKTLTVTDDATIAVAMRKKPAGGGKKPGGGPGGLLDL